MTHAVEKYQKDEQKMRDQEKEVHRKVAQLQLGELTNKKKKKIQAPVMNNDPATMQQPPLQSQTTHPSH